MKLNIAVACAQTSHSLFAGYYVSQWRIVFMLAVCDVTMMSEDVRTM